MMQEFVNQIKKTSKQMISEIHTAVPATIRSYNPDSGLASVQPAAKYRKPNGRSIEYPVISGVPVMFPKSGDVSIAFPVKPGDGCLLVFAEKPLDYWLYGKDTDTDLDFDLSSAIAIPGLSSSGNPAAKRACAENTVVLQAGETTLVVTPGGITVDGDLTVNGRIHADGGISGAD